MAPLPHCPGLRPFVASRLTFWGVGSYSARTVREEHARRRRTCASVRGEAGWWLHNAAPRAARFKEK